MYLQLKMNDEHEEFLNSKILWSIKNNDARVWGLMLHTPVSTKNMRDGVEILLIENDIAPMLTYSDKSKDRYMFIISIDPLWVYAFMIIGDNWNYREYIDEIVSLYE